MLPRPLHPNRLAPAKAFSASETRSRITSAAGRTDLISPMPCPAKPGSTSMRLSRIAAAMTGPATIDWYGMGNGSLPASIQALAHLLAIIRAGLPVIDRLTTVSPSPPSRSEEHTSELQSLMRISYAVFFLKKKTLQNQHL